MTGEAPGTNEPRMEAAVRLDPGSHHHDREDSITTFADLGLVVMVDGDGIGKASARGLVDAVVTHLHHWRGKPWDEARPWADHPLPVAMHLANLQLREWRTGKPGHSQATSASMVAVMRVNDGVLIVRAGAGRVLRHRGRQLEALVPAHAMRLLDYRRVLPTWPRHGILTPLAASSFGHTTMVLEVRFEPLAPGDVLLVGSDALATQVDEALLEETLAGGGSLAAMVDQLWARCDGSVERVSLALARWELPAASAAVVSPALPMRSAARTRRGPGRTDWALTAPRHGLALFTDGVTTEHEHRDTPWLAGESIVGVMDEVMPHDPRVVGPLLGVGVWLTNERKRHLDWRQSSKLLACRTVAAVARVDGGVLIARLGAGSVHRFRGGRLEPMVGVEVAATARGAYEEVIQRSLDRQGQGDWEVRFATLAPGDLFLAGGDSLVARLGPEMVVEVLTSGETLRAMADWLRLEGNERGAGSFVLTGWEDVANESVHEFHTEAPAPMEVTARLDTGKQREWQEDATLVDPELGLALVIDAMGGQGTGQVAAEAVRWSLSAITKAWQGMPLEHHRPWSEHSLPTSIRLANVALLDMMKVASFMGCGGTVAAVQRAGDGVVIAHVGDSRVYRFRGGVLEQMTEDHSLFNEYRKLVPDLTPEQLAELPRNVITRALGMMATVEVDVRFERLAPGDLFLVCSDGLTGEVDDTTIAQILGGESNLEAMADRLLAAVLATEARDNVSLVLARWGRGPAVW